MWWSAGTAEIFNASVSIYPLTSPLLVIPLLAPVHSRLGNAPAPSITITFARSHRDVIEPDIQLGCLNPF